MCVVDRTIEIRAENNLRAEMLRDSLTGLANRLAFSEAIEKAGEDRLARRRSCGADRRHASLLPNQRVDGQPRRRRAADHLRSTADPRASRRGRSGADGRQRIRRPRLATPWRRGRVEGRRTHSAGDGGALQAVRARDRGRVRDRGRADAGRPGPRGAVPQRPVRGQAGQGRGSSASLRAASRRPRPGAASRSRPSCAGRSTRISSSSSTSR